MSLTILLIEDEQNLGESIQKGLQELGFKVDYEIDVKNSFSLIQRNQYDIIVSDIVMPTMTGLEFLSKIRGMGIETPFLFLSALNTTDDKVTGLELGADDYLTKPFEFRELVARINALTKRKTKEIVNEFLACRDLQVDLIKKKVVRGKLEIQLTQREYDLLIYFLNNQDRLISKKELTEKVWGHNFDTGTNVIEVYINYLRSKINFPHTEKLIETVHGQGYRLTS